MSRSTRPSRAPSYWHYEPIKLAAIVAAAERLEVDREATLKQLRLGVERANYEASRAERRYRAVDPDNRLVARGLEREWEESLRALEAAKAELARREAEDNDLLSEVERASFLAVGGDLSRVACANDFTTRPQGVAQNTARRCYYQS